jgi:hypothetical protein
MNAWVRSQVMQFTTSGRPSITSPIRSSENHGSSVGGSTVPDCRCSGPLFFPRPGRLFQARTARRNHPAASAVRPNGRRSPKRHHGTNREGLDVRLDNPRTLRELSNLDKHRLLLPSYVRGGNVSPRVVLATNCQPSLLSYLSDVPLQPGTVIATWMRPRHGASSEDASQSRLPAKYRDRRGRGRARGTRSDCREGIPGHR